MPDQPSLTLVKRFTYRGNPEEWSNTYHFSGGTPPTSAVWKSLADAWWDQERTFLQSRNTLVTAYGYEAGNEISVFSHDYSADAVLPPPGSLDPSNSSGDQAMLVRFTTAKRSVKGRPVYGYKYYHGPVETSTPDQLADLQATPALAACIVLTTGAGIGGAHYCLPQGEPITAVRVSPWTTTRTLKRRGRRPH